MIKKPSNIDRVCAVVVMGVSISIGIDRLLQFLNRIDIVILNCFPLEALLLLKLLLKSMRCKLIVILSLTWCTTASYRVVHLIHHHYVICALVIKIENGRERCLEVPAAASALLIPIRSLVLLPLVLILCRLAWRRIAAFLLVSPSKVQVFPAQVVVVIVVAIYTFIIGVSYSMDKGEINHFEALTMFVFFPNDRSVPREACRALLLLHAPRPVELLAQGAKVIAPPARRLLLCASAIH